MTQIIRYRELEPVELDVKDKKLLYELDFNSRQTYNRLAKKIGLSKQGIEYKINSLIKKGVIKGFYPVINVPKLGYLYCRLMVTLQNLTEETRKEITEYLVGHKKVFWLFSMQGAYDLLIVIWAKSLTEFKEFIEEFQTKYGNYIKRKVESVPTDVVYLKHRFLLGINEVEELHIKETAERVKIDETDTHILEALCRNPRMTLVNIAKEVNESPKVVAYRIKRMEKERIVEAYRPIIDFNILGYTYYKIFLNLFHITKKELSTLKHYLKSNPLVLYIVEGIGIPADIDIEIVVKSNQELFNFIDDIKAKFPKLIAEYIPVVFMDTLKVKYLP